MTTLYRIPENWRPRPGDARRRERQMLGRKKNFAWLQNPPRPYWGKWVILGDGRVLGSGRTRKAAVLAYRASRKRACVVIAITLGPGGISHWYSK